MQLDNQTVVLTGAASGIGRALALLLAKQGCHLALIDCNENGLNDTLASLPKLGRRHSLHVADLADRDAVEALPDKVTGEHGTVNMLINNAGVAIGGSFEQASADDFDWLMQINFHAVVSLCRGFLPLLKSSASPAKIVNVSSLYGLIAPPHQSAYSASKFAVRGFSNALRHELSGSNVSLLVVHPGGVATDIANSAKAPEGISPEEVRLHKKQMNKLLRMPPEKAAETIIKAIRSDKHRVIVGLDAKIVSVIERLMPVNYWRVIEKLTGR
ncbi:SDR family NAD(P)-dependent oxidoreductase [Alteromonas sp. H39]|uniref:SDR family NAD(P)-dependent oxidoreductase n=1 Tax=Alteromonas sp. H39 TaxID=3389876 RepID=UPI0039DFFDE9